MGGTVRGTSGFAEEFASRGPWDDDGRSLREFDLEGRLFRYPLSFLVHSDAFDALPDVARRMFAGRLVAVLSGADTSPDFAHLEPEDRTAILEILEHTEPELLAEGAGEH